MKFAVISDIHGNLKALQIALKDIEQQRCDEIACLGDIVGYGPNPKECVDIVRRLQMHCVKGNFEHYCSSEIDLDQFNPKAAEHIASIRAELSEEDKAWMRALPLVRGISGFTIVHSTLNEPQMWEYVFDRLAAANHFLNQTTPVCFFGHTHVPIAFVRDTTIRGGTYSKFKVEKGRKYFVNVGSIGQPRDNTPRGSYACYDLDTQLIELRRFDLPRQGGSGGDAGFPLTQPPRGNPPLTGHSDP